MPIFEDNPETARKPYQKLTPEEIVMQCATFGRAYKQLERCVKQNPKVNINYKNLVGESPLHRACFAGTPKMVQRLLELKADPNIPATDMYLTPLDYIELRLAKCADHEERLGGWDQVKKLPNYAVHIVPYTDGLEECKKIIKKAGGMNGYMIPEDGFVLRDGTSDVRAYTAGEEGSYTAADIKRSGLYIEVTEEMLEERRKKAEAAWKAKMAEQQKAGKKPFN